MERKAAYDQPLQGMLILVADDEYLIAVTIEETLCDAGAEIVSASTLAAALKSANDDLLTAAVLDVRLGQQTTETVADVLAARAVPFIFYSGQELPGFMRDKHPDARVLIKPTKQSTFVEALRSIARH